MNPTRRAIEIFLNRTAGPVITYIIRTRIAPPESQIEKELAVEYGKIADRMAGREQTRKFPCPVENPEFASKIVREAFEETRKEIGGEHEMSAERMEEVKKRVKARILKKLGAE